MGEELYMARETLAGFPTYSLPAGFTLRWHRRGDEVTWVALQTPFYNPGAITRDTFYKWFGKDKTEHSQRIAYLIAPDGRAIGTAAAWTYDGFRGPEWGRLHWVAVAAEYQGQGLSKSLLSAVLQRMVELGHTAAYLTTGHDRPVAVKLYRRFGFRPI